jgi:hypothetical protein
MWWYIAIDLVKRETLETVLASNSASLIEVCYFINQ